jgi:ABC-type nitrate/sulfonate/bicarbonate transport system ATPase subunit
MVKIENLTYAYKKDQPIFRNFNWSISVGERWSVIGPSGCGKTTLLYLLAGLRNPLTGSVSGNNLKFNGHKISSGLILQDYGLLPWYTARENVALGLKIHKMDSQEISKLTNLWLSKLGIEGVADHFPGELSGGQRQRVAIARTMALEPALLLMDEPFASLDSLTREDLLKLALDLWKNLGSTMVLVTHNIEEAVYWGRHILILSRPPNSVPEIIENPGSGLEKYRNSPEYLNRCLQLRELIERDAPNSKSGD